VQRDKGLIYYVKGGDVSATPSPPPPPKSPAWSRRWCSPAPPISPGTHLPSSSPLTSTYWVPRSPVAIGSRSPTRRAGCSSRTVLSVRRWTGRIGQIPTSNHMRNCSAG